MTDPLLQEINAELYREDAARHGCAGAFDKMVAEGATPQFAAMLLNRRFPATVTDKQFMAGVGTIGKQIKSEKEASMLADVYQEFTGHRPSPNMVYVPSLVPPGEKSGHPMAWVDSGQARTQILKRAKKMNQSLRGRLEYDAVPEPPKKPVPIAPDIVDRLVRQKKQADPSLRTKPDSVVRESVIETHGLKR